MKLDGHFLEVRRTRLSVECWTRRPNKLTLDWMPFVGSVITRCVEGDVVHGELWYPGKPASYVKTAIAARDAGLQFSAFAVPSLPADTSLEDLEDWLTLRALRTVPFWQTTNDVEFDWYVARKHYGTDAEGLVYKDGNLTNHEKWKPVLTTDLVVWDTTYGVGKYLGFVGSLVCGLADGTIVANVSGMTDQERAELTLDPPIGQVVEVEYQYVGAGGRLRHPRFKRMRDDKRAEECVQI